MLTLFYHPRLGYHLLRLSVAALLLMHGLAKLRTGIGGIQGLLAAHDLPTWLAYGVFIGEILAPLMVIAGVFVGPAAFVMGVNMIFAIVLAKSGLWATLGKGGGWGLELEALFLVGSFAIAFMAVPSARKA